jgi:hypothetical protein
MCAEENGSDSSAPAGHPACFLHLPKCAGSAMTSALEAALPPGSLAPWRFDRRFVEEQTRAGLGGARDAFVADDPDLLRPEARALVLGSPDQEMALRDYRAIAGHFSLDTLLSVAPASAVCTVLREPRARLLSVYTFWRTLRSEDESPSVVYRTAANARRPLAEFLANRELASATDNQVCRMLLAGDPRLPATAFATKSDTEGIAADAIERLTDFGFVGILELGESAWRGVGEHFGVSLQRHVMNVTGDLGSAASGSDVGQVFTDDVPDLLQERTAADAILYDYALEHAGVASREERARLKERAFAAQLVRLGDLCGSSAAKAAQYDIVAANLRRLETGQQSLLGRERALQEELRRKDEELARMRGWFEITVGSASWRVTAPLRSAMRWVRGSRSKRTAAR